MEKKTFSIISLGCFRNNYDSGIIREEFLKKGYYFSGDPSGCQVVLVNTCGFIEPAKEESLSILAKVLELKRKKRIEKLIVCGCLVERYKEELKKSYPEVDEWRGVFKLDKFSPPRHPENLHSRFLKISEGCSNTCSFCAIPLIKGSLKSRKPQDILEEVKFLDRIGTPELNLIGQDTTSWGKDLKIETGLCGLLRELFKVSSNISWIRLIYTHPRHITEELLKLIAESKKVCKYIDLPIQHINDRILKAMNRPISSKQIKDLIHKIRKLIPDCVIRTSVIVGFPGETEKEFEELCSFLEDIRFERLGAFIYSREEGTPAYCLKGQVHQGTKKRRYAELMNLQREISAKAIRRFIGKELDVLVEEKNSSHYFGRTQFDAPEVDGGVFINQSNLKIGQFYRVKIIDSYEYDLIAI